MNQSKLTQRLWDKDTSLWTSDQNVAKTIDHRLGWLDCIDVFEKKLVAIRAFAETLPYKHIVLLGMGGSSLVSHVFDQALPNKPRKFFVLDTTDPTKIMDVEDKIKMDDTLFIVASKSGTTIEVDSLFDYFFNLCPHGEQFIAITDFNTPLMHTAEKKKFRHIFINPTDIGGRFAALSYFGLIPFALMGGDVISFVESAKKSIDELKKENNSALILARTLFENHQAGKNKLYFNISKPYSNFGFWLEQLIAESTGKHGKGIIPILSGNAGSDGFPINITLRETNDLAPEFLRWMLVTALVGSMLELNPFDEPNVVSSKKNTGTYLQSTDPVKDIQKKISEIAKSPIEAANFLKGISSPEFVAVLSYIPKNDMIRALSQTAKVPVSICQGPSYLHSTGQLHKGGPNQGRFVVVVDDQNDLPIAGRNYGFQTLKLAQALGDFEALQASDRKVLMVKF